MFCLQNNRSRYQLNVALITIFFLTYVLAACKTADHKNIVLRIGEYHLTIDQMMFKRQNNKNQTLTNSQFKDQLIEDGLILAFAIDHRYDTITALNKLLHYASRSYAVQEDDFMRSKKGTERLALTDRDLKDAYQKRSLEFSFQVVRISASDWKNKYSKIANNFDVLKFKAIADNNTNVFNMPSRFPFFPLSMYVVIPSNAKPGDIFGPGRTEDGYVIARLQSVKAVKQPDYFAQEAGLKEELFYDFTQKHVWEKQKLFLEKATPKVFDVAIRELASKYQERKKSWSVIDPNLQLLQYTYKGQRLPYYVSDFKNFIINQPMFVGLLSNPTDVRKMILTDIMERYAFAEKERMHIDTSQTYLQFKNNYRERLFIEYYKRHHILPKIAVQTNELERYYNDNSNDFKSFESATASVYEFKSFQQALKGRLRIIRFVRRPGFDLERSASDRGNFPTAVLKEIDVRDQGQSPSLIKALAMLNQGQISFPIDDNGRFLVVVLQAKRGSAVLPFKYVADEIKQKIFEEKERQTLSQAIKDLKDRYPLQINQIDAQLGKLSP
jgi:hypothetical protein